MSSGDTSQVVARNIKVLLERRKEEEKRRTMEAKIADAITSFTGSIVFVYLHLVIFGVWIVWNLGILGIEPFDPSFVVLAMAASVEAIFLSTFVLISQNRMNIQVDKRAELDLQISLLAEHELTQLIILVNSMADKMGVEIPEDVEIDQITKDIRPEKVMDEMEKPKKETN
jgi:uncharacterized membrane protein